MTVCCSLSADSIQNHNGKGEEGRSSSGSWCG